MPKKPDTIFKVAKFGILKPAGDMTWDELAQMLKDVRYRVFRLANLAVSEAYLSFHLFRTGRADKFSMDTIGKLSRRLRQMLAEEGTDIKTLDRFSTTGALPDVVAGALHQYKIRAITNIAKWRKVVRGQISLPTFRSDMAIQIRCDKPHQRRLERTENGNVELDLMLCRKPYPRVILQTRNIGPSQETILERLLTNTPNSKGKYRQRLFEIKQDTQTGKWWLYVTYEVPLSKSLSLDPDVIVGIDLGFSVPMYAAINSGHARLGRRHFQPLANRIRSLQSQVLARRRAIQRGGRADLSRHTARSAHGRKRKLLPIEKLRSKIDKSYTTLNHQLSTAVIDFAKNHSAGTIQVEDLTGLKDQLTGTFLGARWRYHQLQQFIEYKAQEAGINFQKVNPKFTSRRCSKCGLINKDFDRAYRNKAGTAGRVARFVCPECGYEADPDYNAARNISTLDIEKKIAVQCHK